MSYITRGWGQVIIVTYMKKEKLLEVKNLKVTFFTPQGALRAIDGISFKIGKGEVFGLAGESGCGKSVTVLSLAKLYNPFIKMRIEGEVIFEGKNLLAMGEKELNKIRGKDISYIFQNPFMSLNPVFRIGWQIEEAIKYHRPDDKKNAKDITIDMLKKVGISETKYTSYPHELSGGQQQRAMIAMALVANPKLLILDEPTTALDVTVERQIINLLKELKEKFDLTMIFITHDLDLMKQIAGRIAIMYTGRIVEEGSVSEIFTEPRHPYTEGLLNSLPSFNEDKEYLTTIKGMVAPLLELPEGCHFRERCDLSYELCDRIPEERIVYPDHKYLCWR